jgi:hypothetical protein
MKSVNTRYPDDLHEQVKAASEEDERSFNGEVVWLLRQGLAARATTPVGEKEPQP